MVNRGLFNTNDKIKHYSDRDSLMSHFVPTLNKFHAFENPGRINDTFYRLYVKDKVLTTELVNEMIERIDSKVNDFEKRYKNHQIGKRVSQL